MSASNTESSELREVTLLICGMTCNNCVERVRADLLGLSGVSNVELELSQSKALVWYDSSKVDIRALQEAVGKAGYGVGETPSVPDGEQQVTFTTSQPDHALPLAVVSGVAAAMALLGFYTAILTIAQDWYHAVEFYWTDWPFVLAIVAGFGTQIGLFVYIRIGFRARLRGKTTSALAGAGTGTSTVSMLSCCVHHLTDVLPIIGLAGAAAFFTEYRVPFMLFGIAMNLVGIVFMIRLIRRLQCEACTARPIQDS